VLGSTVKLTPTLILFCLCVAAGCTTNRNQAGSDKLAAQYSRLKRPIDKAVFCLNHWHFFFRAPSDAEFRSVFGDGVDLPSATTNVVMNADKPEWRANVQERVVRIMLYDEQAPEGVQLPPSWWCVAHYRDQRLLWLYVEPFKESK
jgi:hypothetical protein